MLTAVFLMAKDEGAVILFDEIDMIIKGAHKRLRAIHEALDGVKNCPGIFVCATTNNPEKLGDALIRRFHPRCFIDSLDTDGNVHFITGWLARSAHCHHFTPSDIKEIAEKFKNRSPGDIAGILTDVHISTLSPINRESDEIPKVPRYGIEHVRHLTSILKPKAKDKKFNEFMEMHVCLRKNHYALPGPAAPHGLIDYSEDSDPESGGGQSDSDNHNHNHNVRRERRSGGALAVSNLLR